MHRLVPRLLAVFGAISLLIFAFGDAGLLAYRDLSAYRDRLQANVADLQARNDALQAKLADLRSNADTEEVLARGVGLYLPGQSVVKLEGSAGGPTVNAIGDMLRHKAPATAMTPIFKTAGAAGCLALVVLALLSARARRRSAHAAAGR